MKREPLAIEQRTLSELIPYASNARTHSEAQVAQIAASIKEFGFNDPVAVDESGIIIEGHGRVLAAHKLGMQHAPTITLHGLTEEQKKAYRLAHNQLPLNAEWDTEVLAFELDNLRDMNVDLGVIGFDRKELNDLIGTPDIANTEEQMGGMEFRVIVDCTSEEHQAQLLQTFKESGLTCRALIS